MNYQPNVHFPELKWVALKNLVPLGEIQRSETKSHTITMEQAIRDSGFMDVIKVFPKNYDGTYDIAESTHRFRALKNIYIDNLDVEVPCAVLHWKNKEDRDEIQKTIIDLNVNNKDWETYDYVQSHAAADWRDKRVHKTFVEIRDNMKEFQKLSVSNGVIASVYTKSLRNHDVLKKHELAKNFYVRTKDREFVNLLLSTLRKLRLDFAKKEMAAPFLRKYVYHLWRKAKELQYDYNEWYLFVDKSVEYIVVKLSDPKINTMPGDDEAFDAWFFTIKIRK
tara:strand:- start:197 stop:1033 length:837 start_codon:yes stop_codon:yes gene_type:complete